MDFSMCPRAKRTVRLEGEFQFDELRLFTVGGGERFVRALRVLCPTLPVRAVSREEANVVLSVSTVFSSQNEYCYFRILEDCMEIHARDEMGARNAAAILAQIIRPNGAGFRLPCGTVEDYPDAQYRGFMLESSGRENTWMEMSLIKEYIRQMALARMNEVQFHFMEYNGTTIELDCYPELHGDYEGNRKYTKAEVRDMIAYAEELGMTVTPFVEILSHSQDFTTVAGVGCPGDDDPEHTFAVCLGQEKTFEAIERVLTEVAELFPAPVLHIGCDEYDMRRTCPLTAYWDRCPHCLAKMKELGFTTMRELFHYALERINRMVNKLGKITMLWNADMKPGELPRWLERNMIVHYFRFDHPYAKEMLFEMYPDGYVKDGYTVLNSYYPNTYLDDSGYYAKDMTINQWSCYREPAVSAENRARLVGGCVCAWCGISFIRTIPPSIFLFADRLWNANDAGVPYDNEYGRVITRLLFDGKLPETMNVFRMVGRMQPPQHPEKLVNGKYIVAPISEVREIKAALEELAATGHRLAGVYAGMAAAAEEYLAAQPDELLPLDHHRAFIG
ncbi:MAG: family 20 glycosylhydrolase [Clostridia bacterium]|nr:family 20 glycosylhydrolase [Clostridia bacterium]